MSSKRAVEYATFDLVVNEIVGFVDYNDEY